MSPSATLLFKTSYKISGYKHYWMLCIALQPRQRCQILILNKRLAKVDASNPLDFNASETQRE